MTTHCPHCGWPDSQPYSVVSRHATAAGMTVWVRCACGSVQIREIGASGVRIVSRGRPSPDGASSRCST
ncbi:hypothetical protein AB0I72_14730 [Nocardiopsis sp. NPDC049922]|uniref:hypothetical protein n=1 Tax=Nocardiopsis sp. NPDC049922 TaxID=3155157 RepID=UPI0034043BDF